MFQVVRFSEVYIKRNLASQSSLSHINVLQTVIVRQWRETLTFRYQIEKKQHMPIDSFATYGKQNVYKTG